jgi:hypothetical protein
MDASSVSITSSGAWSGGACPRTMLPNIALLFVEVRTMLLWLCFLPLSAAQRRTGEVAPTATARLSSLTPARRRAPPHTVLVHGAPAILT